MYPALVARIGMLTSKFEILCASQSFFFLRQDLNRLLLTVELSSDSDQEYTFKLNQVSSVSYSWRLEPLQEQRKGIEILETQNS